ncbi:uncharacterized protein AKAME5_001933300 [Lates japonicus]|uniref:Uncharacterized protein n=1 Tax=Lates japonicus TaxID=270547 RepID=A0AAD3RHA4_LATJO|nr:uncharacterized protein AKAME5_001933300 [Lates japonicus]
MDRTISCGSVEQQLEIGVTFILIYGWIAGPAMIVGGAIEMSQASDAVDRAKKEVENCESQAKVRRPSAGAAVWGGECSRAADPTPDPAGACGEGDG